VTTEQTTGLLQALGPIVVGVLVYWGVDSATAGYLATGILALIAAAWSFYSNQPATALANAVQNMDDVQVVVGPNASANMRSLAADPCTPNIIERREG